MSEVSSQPSRSSHPSMNKISELSQKIEAIMSEIKSISMLLDGLPFDRMNKKSLGNTLFYLVRILQTMEGEMVDKKELESKCLELFQNKLSKLIIERKSQAQSQEPKPQPQEPQEPQQQQEPKQKKPKLVIKNVKKATITPPTPIESSTSTIPVPDKKSHEPHESQEPKKRSKKRKGSKISKDNDANANAIAMGSNPKKVDNKSKTSKKTLKKFMITDEQLKGVIKDVKDKNWGETNIGTESWKNLYYLSTPLPSSSSPSSPSHSQRIEIYYDDSSCNLYLGWSDGSEDEKEIGRVLISDDYSDGSFKTSLNIDLLKLLYEELKSSSRIKELEENMFDRLTIESHTE